MRATTPVNLPDDVAYLIPLNYITTCNLITETFLNAIKTVLHRIIRHSRKQRQSKGVQACTPSNGLPQREFLQ